ncbi:MAG: SoxR reducing system RseC family protein [bacterium]
MQFLPTSEEQTWLVSRLAELIEKQGAEQFIDMPVVEPTREYFPDAWTFSHEGLDRVVRRLMQYAGLGNLDVKVGTYVETEHDAPETMGGSHSATAGVFMGITDGTCLFGFNEHTPPDAEFMAGVMCHEVAHAYRHYHGLAGSAPDGEEELLTDLATVYLGFGILAVNNSFRYKTGGGWGYQFWSSLSAGYLPPQALAFALAIQIGLRNISPGERNRLLKHLETDQAAFTKAALKEVTRRKGEIIRELRFELDDRAGRPKQIEDILQPLPEYVAPEDPTDGETSEKPPGYNSGRPVFRVPRSRAADYGLIGLLVGAGVGIFAGALLGEFVLAALVALMGTVAGFFWGAKKRYDVCSDPGCEAVLGSADTCPSCGGRIVGAITHASDRLEAVEDWERRAKQRPAESRRAGEDRRRPTNNKNQD